MKPTGSYLMFYNLWKNEICMVAMAKCSTFFMQPQMFSNFLIQSLLNSVLLCPFVVFDCDSRAIYGLYSLLTYVLPWVRELLQFKSIGAQSKFSFLFACAKLFSITVQKGSPFISPCLPMGLIIWFPYLRYTVGAISQEDS